MSQSSIFNLQSSIHSVRDFYAFEQHVKTCRGHRGLDMVPQWYQVPAFYFSNPVAIIGDGDPVHAPQEATPSITSWNSPASFPLPLETCRPTIRQWNASPASRS